jgi:Tfp pilus assembly protein PilF
MNGVKSFYPVLQWAFCFLVVIVSSCATQGSQMTSEDLHKKMADEYYRQRDYKKAKQELLWVLQAAPDDVETNFRLGVIYANEGFVEKSRGAFEKVLFLDSDYSKAYYNLAVLYAKGHSQNEVNQSIRYFDKYLELEPDSEHRYMIEKWKLRRTTKTTKDVAN